MVKNVKSVSDGRLVPPISVLGHLFTLPNALVLDALLRRGQEHLTKSEICLLTGLTATEVNSAVDDLFNLEILYATSGVVERSRDGTEKVGETLYYVRNTGNGIAVRLLYEGLTRYVGRLEG